MAGAKAFLVDYTKGERATTHHHANPVRIDSVVNFITFTQLNNLLVQLHLKLNINF
jgi:hypothetical protein